MMWAMPARENETASADTEIAAEPPQVAATEDKQEFTTEGDLPAVATSSAAVAVTASEMAFDGKDAPIQDTAHLDKGMHHWEQYKAACEAAGKAEKWKDVYRNGHTEAKGWSQPYEHRRVNDFTLQKGYSASEALEAFMKGPTICDYRAALLADEVDELRDEMGDHKFDRLFGSKDQNQMEKIPAHQRLRISSDLYTTPLVDQMKAIAAETDARETNVDEPAPAPIAAARVEEKPAELVVKDQDPVIVAQELGADQRDREIV
jgi:hypothetical protein